MVGCLALVAGVFIGAIGIGGIILVSGLIYLGDLEPRAAISACLMGYILTGAVGTWVYARAKSIRWPMAFWLCAGAMPGAFSGSWATNNAASGVLELGIGALTAAAGLHGLRAGHGEPKPSSPPNGPVLAAIGLFTGFGSALTGTGGPLLLVPILLWLQLPILTAVGLSQVIQVPIALLATLSNFFYGAIDLRLGALIAATLALGTWLGARIAHMAPKQALRRLVAIALALIGAMIILRIAYRSLAPA
jgi:uncharacterized protein